MPPEPARRAAVERRAARCARDERKGESATDAEGPARFAHPCVCTLNRLAALPSNVASAAAARWGDARAMRKRRP
jgi:hypothetical protein